MGEVGPFTLLNHLVTAEKVLKLKKKSDMTIQELLDELQEIEDKGTQIIFCGPMGDLWTIEEILNEGDRVILT